MGLKYTFLSAYCSPYLVNYVSQDVSQEWDL